MLVFNHEPNKNNLSSISNSTPSPLFSLVFYGVKSERGGFCGVTKHEINNGIIGTGNYVDLEQVKDLFTEKEDTLLLRNANVIAENSRYIVWVSPPRKSPMWFRCSGSKPVRFDVHWTRLLFVASKKGSLSVFALSTNKTPDLNTIVYHAPLMNIGSTGSVCQGTAKLPEIIDTTTLSDIEDTIYTSFFTHVNHKQTLNTSSNGCTTPQQFKFWKKKAKTGDKVLAKEMVKFGTLKDVLGRFS